MKEAFLWYLLSVLPAVRGVTHLGSAPWPLVAAWRGLRRRVTLIWRNTGAVEMALQNVTLALPGDLLREARHLAVNQGVSLSRFLALVLEERVERARRYRAARERAQGRLREGLGLGIGEQIPWTRDELHER